MVKIKELLSKINYATFLTYTALSLLIGLVFNISLKEYVFRSDIYIAVFLVLILGILVAVYGRQLVSVIKQFKKRDIIFSGIVLAVIPLWVVVRNGDLAHGNFGKPFFTLYAMLLVFLFTYIDELHKPALRVVAVFAAEHVFFTWLCFIFPTFYKKYIMRLFPEFVNELTWQFEHRQIAGITMHYSTNALYLVIGLLLFAALLFATKRYKLYLAPTVITFAALLLTGKRGTMVFAIGAIVLMYIAFNIDNLKKTLIRVGVAVAVGAALLLIVSLFIPTIAQSFTRFFGQADITNGRMPMYELAINEFKESPLFGIGWGGYKYEFDAHGVAGSQSTMDAHNVYLQLLCETGVIGFIFFVGLMGYLLYITVRQIVVQKQRGVTIVFSLGIQLFFLMYAITGNPLYDVQILYPYIISAAIALHGKNSIDSDRE